MKIKCKRIVLGPEYSLFFAAVTIKCIGTA